MAERGHKQTVEERTAEIADPLIAGMGMELVDVEFLHERDSWILRLFIDKPGGVGLEDCEAVSRAVETPLEVEDIVGHAYHLEVSSPGLERPLKKPEHFQRAEGRVVRVKTFAPLGEPPRRNFRGVLTAVVDDGVTVDVEGAGSFRIPFRDIAKANLDFEVKR
jgi:ribosome maturation factor RimP